MRSGKSNGDGFFIREALQEDRQELFDLWRECFGDTGEFTRYYFDSFFPVNTVWIAENEDGIVAQLHLNPYKLKISEEEMEGIYLVGVCTREKYRHRGIMTRLIAKVFEREYEAGLPFIYLMPADENIYLPFGFRYIYAQDVLSLVKSGDTVPDCRSKSAFKDESTLIDYDAIELSPVSKDEDFERIAELASERLRKCAEVYTLRDPDYFRGLKEQSRSENGDLLLLKSGNDIIGYISYIRDEKIHVLEYYALKGYVGQAWNYLEREFFDIDSSILYLPESLPGLLSNTHDSFKWKKRPIIMGRVIHAGRFLEMMGRQMKPLPMEGDGCPDESGLQFSLFIRDEFIPQNNGLWLWSLGEDGGAVHLEDGAWDMALDIADLMRWLMGYSSLEELLDQGLVKVKDTAMEKLVKIPAIKRLFINEVV